MKNKRTFIVLIATVGIIVFSVFLIFFLDDNSGTRNFQPTLRHFTCEEVAPGTLLGVHPRTGESTDQFDRRAMIETRIFDCFWQEYSKAIALRNGNNMQNTGEDMLLNNAFQIFLLGFEKYVRGTMRPLNGVEKDYHISLGSASWMYSCQAMALLEKVFGRHTGEICVSAETINDFSMETDDLTGLIHDAMQFYPLSEMEHEILKKLQNLHTLWTEKALKRANDADLEQIVEMQHAKHHVLEAMARTPDQQVLYTIPIHIPHYICWERPTEEVDKLILEAETYHQAWTRGVLERNFHNTWLSGLQHARAHILLATCGVDLPAITEEFLKSA